MHSAARGNSPEIVEALINAGAQIDSLDERGVTPLHLAVAENPNGLANVDIVRALVYRGADINARDRQGRTPLYRAAVIGSEDVTKVLIQKTLIQDFSIQRPDYLAGASSTYWDRCLGEVRELNGQNEPLHDFLKESDVDQLVSIWQSNENVRSSLNDEEELQRLYPEYANILINKANEAKRGIFLHNHKPLIDVLPQLGYHGGGTPDEIKAFLENNRDKFKVKLGIHEESLIDFVDFEDVAVQHTPKLKLCSAVSVVIRNNAPSGNLGSPSTEQLRAVYNTNFHYRTNN